MLPSNQLSNSSSVDSPDTNEVPYNCKKRKFYGNLNTSGKKRRRTSGKGKMLYANYCLYMAENEEKPSPPKHSCLRNMVPEDSCKVIAFVFEEWTKDLKGSRDEAERKNEGMNVTDKISSDSSNHGERVFVENNNSSVSCSNNETSLCSSFSHCFPPESCSAAGRKVDIIKPNR